MRKRELVAKLKDDERELRRSLGVMFVSRDGRQELEQRRMMILHRIERLLPEIIEKLEG